MCLDWNNIDKTSKSIDYHFFHPFYDQLYSSSKKHRFVQLSAPFVGALDGIASGVQAAAGVAEAALKGSRNLLYGASSCDTDSLKRGILQIGLGGVAVGIVSIPVIFIRTLRITVGMVKNPVETAHTQAENYRKKIAAPVPASA